MPTTDWITPGAVQTSGTVNWSNPSNALVSDGSYATLTATFLDALSTKLCFYNFGLALPNGAHITNVEWELGQKYATSAPTGVMVALQDKDDVISTSSGGGTVTPTSTTDTVNTGNVVGASTVNGVALQDYAASVCNSSDFALCITNASWEFGESGIWSIDFARFRFTYSEPVTPEGPNSPSSVISVAGPATQWANPSNAASSDNLYATMTPSQTEAGNAFLRATSFGNDVPDTATIAGVKVEIERHRSGGTTGQIQDDVVRLVTGPESFGTPTDTGWVTWSNVYFPQNGTSSSSYWTNLANAQVDDGTFATGTVSGGGIEDPTFYGFDFSSVPKNARLDAIQIQVKVRASGGTPPYTNDIDVYWAINNNGEGAQINQLITPTDTTTTFIVGSSSSLSGWGKLVEGSTTRAIVLDDIFDPTFGVGFIFNANAQVYELYYVAMKVYYTPGSAAEGANKATGANWGTTTNTYTTYGGENDLWNVDLTPAIVNSSDFGAQLRVDNTGNRVANVDHIRITTYYFNAPTPGSPQYGSTLFWAFP